jgi:hypothetical protein
MVSAQVRDRDSKLPKIKPLVQVPIDYLQGFRMFQAIFCLIVQLILNMFEIRLSFSLNYNLD